MSGWPATSTTIRYIRGNLSMCLKLLFLPLPPPHIYPSSPLAPLTSPTLIPLILNHLSFSITCPSSHLPYPYISIPCLCCSPSSPATPLPFPFYESYFSNYIHRTLESVRWTWRLSSRCQSISESHSQKCILSSSMWVRYFNFNFFYPLFNLLADKINYHIPHIIPDGRVFILIVNNNRQDNNRQKNSLKCRFSNVEIISWHNVVNMLSLISYVLEQGYILCGIIWNF